MTKLLHPVLVVVFTVAAAAAPASNVTYTVIANLNYPYTEPYGLIEGSPGVFYITSSGSIFSVTSQGMVTGLASYPDPPYIVASAPGAIGANGLFYSSIEHSLTYWVGNVISAKAPPPTLTTYPNSNWVIFFAPGSLPSGDLFGIAYDVPTGSINLAIADLNGNVVPLYQFPASYVGGGPSTPIYGDYGSYYGIFQAVGSPTASLYQFTPSGAFNVTSLPFCGIGTVLQGSDGNFYGIQPSGCSLSSQPGAVFKLTPAGQFSILHDFGVASYGFSTVESLIEGSDGKLYGDDQYASLFFSLTKSGHYEPLFQATDPYTQGICPCAIIQGSDGIIYGTAVYGGSSSANDGVIFALDAGLPVPKPRQRHFSPLAGRVSTKVRIWGQNLFGASVQFNGAAATTVTNGGPDYVWATVPAGATTGPITVTTPGGSSTLKPNFTVK